jgi:branched-chain amino acid transport system substrate-binding protein
MKAIFRMLLVCTTIGLYAQHPAISVDHSQEIVFGQSAGFTGHFSYYATTIKHAIMTCFEHINKKGGINGKKLRLISLDDQSDADITKQNIEMLYTKHGVTMFIGVMGTRGVLATLPLIQEKKIGMYFPWASSKELRNSSLTNIINGFGLLEPQLDFIIHHLVKELNITNIAIFNADDTLSKNAAEYAKKKIASLSTEQVTSASYNRFTMNISKPCVTLFDIDPRAIISIATSVPTVKLINYFFNKGSFGTMFYGIDSTFLVKDILHTQGSYFHYTSSVPDPLTSDIVIAQEYRANMSFNTADPDYSILSFSYYIAANLICQALEHAHNGISNATIIQYLESLKKTSFKGFPVNFDTTNRYLFGNTVWLI